MVNEKHSDFGATIQFSIISARYHRNNESQTPLGKGGLTDVQAILPSTQDDGDVKFAVYTSLDAAEAVWREIETRGVLTPYQRFDWNRAFMESGGEPFARPIIITLLDADGVIALLPLVVERRRRYGVSRARFLGSCVSNSDWPIIDPLRSAKLTSADIGRVLRAVSREVGFDMVGLSNQPESWQSVTNPLLGFPHGAAPSHLYCATIEPDPRPFLEYGLSSKDRKNIRRGIRQLTESHGPVTVRRARTAADIERIHETFLAQRGKRFVEMGVENLFAEDCFVAFFRSLAVQGLGDATPALAFHALYAGDTILATSCGAFTGTHYSKYMNSTTAGPEARFYLTGIMMVYLIDELKLLGIRSFDMGIGDFAYKADWADPRSVYDAIIPMTRLGHLAAPGFVAARRFKRAVKQNERLWKMARLLKRTARHWTRQDTN
ncbi:GNAT family N-acetyltransferase [Terrihabitans sp. B22-R8]|uniref:GNAT family N-acetyltransferase n=1 Tax=Terrihabitans sp. B22-R8 TaxID=3425128 RepID=UPI00403C4335